jgi:hypothetical protein
LAGGQRTLHIPWSAFVPYFHGRPYKGDDRERPPHTRALPPPTPLNATRVAGLSFMCASDFGKQDGSFQLEIVRVSVY